MSADTIMVDDFGFAQTRILLIGDLMLDRFRYGAVTRISPEAPVPVMRVERETAMLGGAGNVLANLIALGSRCRLIAVVGNDAAGQQCQDLFARSGSDPASLVVVDGRRTTIKTRLVSGIQQLLRCDEEDNDPLDPANARAVMACFDSQVADAQIVLISDYAKGLLTEGVLRHIIDTCRARGLRCIVDPKRKDMRAYAGATLIKPNRSELAAATGLPCTDFATMAEAADRVIAETGSAVLLTMSGEGMALFRRQAEVVHCPASAADVYDVSGAGDTVLAVLGAALASGMALERAVRVANMAAGVVVRKPGTATLTQHELAVAIDGEDQFAHSGLVTLDQAKRRVRSWKEEGLRVGFTNGCFDIVHAGHIEILRQARQRCDRLVVGLNSDASVQRLKGPGRPIQAQASRAAVLSAIDAVDLVVVFDELTPLHLIETLMPTDLIKGADYAEDAVVGAREVKAAGGRVHLIDLVPGLSTTSAVERIRAGGDGSSASPARARQSNGAQFALSGGES